MSACAYCQRALPFAALQCSACGTWSPGDAGPTGTVSRSKVTTLDNVAAAEVERLVCRRFWDPIWGGGIVPSSVTLLTGAPGQGKTTLLLGISSAIANLTSGKYAYYLSAEQSPGEIRLTADRLGIDNLNRFVVLQSSSGGGAEIDGELLQAMPPALFVVDSLSALHGKDIRGQVVTCIRYKALSVAWKAPSILILHMTKTGDIAGKAELHHACDTICCMEPAPEHMGSGVRELISYKNRFGPSHQPVYLIMTPTGLAEAPPKETARKRAGRIAALLVPPNPEKKPERLGGILPPPPALAPVEDKPEPPRRRARSAPAPDSIEVGGQKLVRVGKTRAPRAAVLRPESCPDNDPPEPEAA